MFLRFPAHSSARTAQYSTSRHVIAVQRRAKKAATWSTNGANGDARKGKKIDKKLIVN